MKNTEDDDQMFNINVLSETLINISICVDNLNEEQIRCQAKQVIQMNYSLVFKYFQST